jgi:hypothetical protein
MKKSFLKLLAVGLIFLSATNLSIAQVYKNITDGSDGLTIRGKSGNGDVTGNAYLFDNWLNGRVQFSDGSQPQQGQLKYDALDHLLVTKGAGDVENMFTSAVNQFDLEVDGKWFRYVNGFEAKNLKPSYFVRIVYQSPKTALYQLETKSILESKDYNSPTVHRKIESSVYYFLQVNPADKKVVPVKKDNKSILAALQKPQLASYLKEKKLNLKNDDDLQVFLVYYDSL